MRKNKAITSAGAKLETFLITQYSIFCVIFRFFHILSAIGDKIQLKLKLLPGKN